MSAISRHGSDIRWGAALFATAFAVRLAFVLWINPNPLSGVPHDANFYHNAAHALAAGRGYIFPGRGPAPTAFWPPGYPGMLAAVYLLPGPDVIAGKLLNVAFGAFGVVGVFVLGRIMWDRATGIAAALVLVFFPSHIIFETLPLSEVAFSTLLTTVMVPFVMVLRRDSMRVGPLPLILGLCVGAISLVRGEWVLLPVLFGILWWVRTKAPAQAFRFAGLAFIGLALVISVWTVRNLIELHAPVPISTASSLSFSLGNWEGADGYTTRARNKQMNSDYAELPYPEREVRISQKYFREGVRYMFTHPRREASLVPRRLFYLYRHDHAAMDWVARKELPVGKTTVDRLRTISDVYYFACLAAAAFGAVLWWRHDRLLAMVPLGMVLYLSLIIGILFFGDQRYHASLVPAFCLLAAPALVAGLRTLRQAAGRQATGGKTAP